MLKITCESTDCLNYGISIRVESSFTDPITGETIEAKDFVCGPCGHEITDIEGVNT